MTRARERMLSDGKTALGEHYRDFHAKVESPSTTFQILNLNPLHIKAAIAIWKFNPALNHRRLTQGTGLLPYFMLIHAAATPKSPESKLTPTPAMHSHQPSTDLSRYQPFSFFYKKPSKPPSDQGSIPSWPIDDGVLRQNVLKSLPTFPADIYKHSNLIYCAVSIVCCVCHVCSK